MGKMEAEHRCYACHREFKYNYAIYKKGIETLATNSVEADEVIATGITSGSAGAITHYEFIVTCPYCKTKNKIIK
ncbi:carbon monoxide dehydrogenase [Clostridium sp.]|uniref:carbon monoxide dehydrogenase n=1 Tax=Clostridium sp. TaxID=1506 RepID=UPI002628B194|nr:carbon monoxide dehydrogenase [Clostridium sp.]